MLPSSQQSIASQGQRNAGVDGNNQRRFNDLCIDFAAFNTARPFPMRG
jgi:hypothetical protein